MVTVRARRLLLGGALVVAFVVARVVPFLGAHIGRGFDTYDYRFVASFPPLSRAFLAGSRPFGYPLYLKLMKHNEHAVVVGQLVLDTLAWLALGLMVARSTRNAALKFAASFAVLAIGATFEAIQWDRIVSSEALSNAFGIGVLAAILWLRERWTAPRVALVGLLALMATLLRDSNGTFFGVVALVLAIGVVARLLPRRVLALAAVLLAVAIAGSVSATMGRRWEAPFRNVVTVRIMNSPERLDYLTDAGMPISAAQIKAARGQCISPFPIAGCRVVVDPAFYDWIHRHGRLTYAGMLLHYPATTVWEPVSHLRYSIGTRVRTETTSGSAERAPLSSALEAVFFVRNPPLVAAWAVATLCVAVIAFVRRKRGVYLVAAAVVALVYPHLFVVWIGDALEVTRHSVLASIQLRVGLWLAAVWLLDAFLDRSAADQSAPDQSAQ